MFTLKIVRNSNNHVRLLSAPSVEYWEEIPEITITKYQKKYKINGIRFGINLREKGGILIKQHVICNATVYIMQNGKTVETLKAKEVEELITDK